MGWIREQQLPTYCLPDCSSQNGMRVANGACRQFPIDHNLICRLDLERRE